MINHINENALLDNANSPELDRKLFGKLSEDFVKVCDQLKEASYQIVKRGFSTNPIFVVSSQDLEIGVLLIASGELSNSLNYRASYLQEFIDRKLIGEESVELFKENSRPTEEFCCIFYVAGDFAGFVYIPYPED